VAILIAQAGTVINCEYRHAKLAKDRIQEFG